jgi:hypothetical protein
MPNAPPASVPLSAATVRHGAAATAADNSSHTGSVAKPRPRLVKVRAGRKHPPLPGQDQRPRPRRRGSCEVPQFHEHRARQGIRLLRPGDRDRPDRPRRLGPDHGIRPTRRRIASSRSEISSPTNESASAVHIHTSALAGQSAGMCADQSS